VTNADPPAIKRMFSYFMQKLYNHPWLDKAIFVLFVERNLPAGPYAIEEIMMKYYPRRYIIEDPVRNLSGWWTDRHMKLEYVITGAKQMAGNKIFFLESVITECPWMTADTRANICYNKLIEQIPRFRIQENGKIDGKHDENGKKVKGAKDDTALTFFMALYFLNGISNEDIPGFDYTYIKQMGL
jgi:hypothetical protein